jgi:hypothetical protein
MFGAAHPLPTCSYDIQLLPDLLFNLTVRTPLSLVGGPLSGNGLFTESHIIYVISLLLVALLTKFILNN